MQHDDGDFSPPFSPGERVARWHSLQAPITERDSPTEFSLFGRTRVRIGDGSTRNGFVASRVSFGALTSVAV